MRNMTTAIFKKPVIVTTNRGMRPAAVKKTTTPRMLTLASDIVEKPCDPNTQAVADLDQIAPTDATTVRENVDAVFERPLQREQRTRHQLPDLCKRQLNASQFKEELYGNVVKIDLLQKVSPRCVCPVFHAPLPQ